MRTPTNVAGAKKICIVGRAGSGKSYLATRLGELLNLPVIYMDIEFWLPNWEHVDRETLYNNVTAKMGDSWIIDGGYLGNEPLLEYRFALADLIIHIDVPIKECIKNAKTRRNQPRPDFPHFLDESNDNEFAGLIELIETWEERSTRMFELIDPAKLLTLKGKSQVDAFLAALSG